MRFCKWEQTLSVLLAPLTFASWSWLHLFFIRVLFLCVTVLSGGKDFIFQINWWISFKTTKYCWIPSDCNKIPRCRTETTRRQSRKTVSFIFVVKNNEITIIVPLFSLVFWWKCGFDGAWKCMWLFYPDYSAT